MGTTTKLIKEDPRTGEVLISSRLTEDEKFEALRLLDAGFEVDTVLDYIDAAPFYPEPEPVSPEEAQAMAEFYETRREER